MKPLKIATLFLALLPLICCVAWIIALSHNLSRLRDESLELRAELEALQQIPKKAEQVREPAPQAAKGKEPSEAYELFEKEHRELLRLRNEVSGLRRENEQIKDARLADLNARVLASVDKAHRSSELAYVGTWLGIGIRGAEDLTNPILRQGVIVTQINAGSPSGRQLEVGDIIFGLNNTTFAGTTEFKNLVSAQQSGVPVVLSINRHGESMNVTVTPGERAEHSARAFNPYD